MVWGVVEGWCLWYNYSGVCGTPVNHWSVPESGLVDRKEISEQKK